VRYRLDRMVLSIRQHRVYISSTHLTLAQKVEAAPNSCPCNSESHPTVQLYIALAVILLLLSVAIVSRLFVLRRRRMMGEAGDDDPRIPFHTSRDSTINPGAKPDMFEIFLAGEKDSLGNRYANGDSYVHRRKENVNWDAITPLSATYLLSPNCCDVLRTSQPTYPMARTSHVKSLSPARHAYASSTSEGPNCLGLRPDILPPLPSMLRAVVLIIMPSPVLFENGRREEEKSFPRVEFGVVDVCIGEESDREIEGQAE